MNDTKVPVLLTVRDKLYPIHCSSAKSDRCECNLEAAAVGGNGLSLNPDGRDDRLIG